MSLMGDEGLRNVALHCHQGLNQLLDQATAIDGVTQRFSAPVFHEVALALPKPASEVLKAMAAEGVLGGYDLGGIDPALSDCLLVNVTETKTEADISRYVELLGRAVA